MSEEIFESTKNFLQNAPPGEYEQCSNALKSILPDPDVLVQARNETLQTWTQEQCRSVEINGHRAIICEEALQSDGTYLDPITMQTYQYNFESRVPTPTGNTVTGSEFRNSLQEEINSYVNKAYKENAAGGAFDTADGNVVIVLSSESVSLNNYRTGKTLAKYTVSPNGSLKGHINSMQHFFEQGNALCEHGGDCDKTVTFGDAKGTVKAIKLFEEKWLDSYKETLDKIGESILFKLRRKMPVQKTKINWLQEITVGGGMHQ